VVSGVTKGLPSRSPPIQEPKRPDALAFRPFRSVDAVDGLFQVAVGFGHGLEQAFAEIEQAVLDLVAHLRLAGAHLVGFPQYLDLLLELADQLKAPFLAGARVVQLLGGEEDAAQVFHDGAALGFGGVGGEYRDVGRLVEQGLEFRGADALVVELPQGGVERALP
jgi:hypothetical protein